MEGSGRILILPSEDYHYPARLGICILDSRKRCREMESQWIDLSPFRRLLQPARENTGHIRSFGPPSAHYDDPRRI